MAKATFHLGGVIDPSSGDRTGAPLDYDADDLTTHGVIVGMTGSGKTGLGMIYLEEALRNGIPTLVLDPKGDMTNLLLTFPDLAPSDFRPWVDEAEAARDGKTPEEAAEGIARLWKNGLESWGLSGDDIAALRREAGMTLYTPGSTAGVPLDVLGSLRAPAGGDLETMRDEIEGLVSGLLGLVGVESDPLSGREHILLSNLIETAWADGSDLSLETLIASVGKPPMRKLGVFELDTFFPEKDRMALAMRLNALAASPSFAAWRSGPPLDPQAMLWGDDGRPQAAIVYLAHLSDDERQFVVTTVLSKLITWMRSQSGSGNLRVLVYMDEVFGFVPPTAMPPAKKPILTLLKQARAFGVGMLLSTQNPVDLDYKAMSNAGTWCIGRLQTERDKMRILEALQSATGAVDIDALDRLVSALGKRQFLLHNTRDRDPSVFTTRWAMSYLRGPLTRDQVAQLVGDDPRRDEKPVPVEEAPPDDALSIEPKTPSAVRAVYADPAAPWLTGIGASPRSAVLAPAVAVRVHLTFDDTRADVDHDEEWEAIYFPLDEEPRPEDARPVDHDPRDFLDSPPDGASFRMVDAPIDTAAFYSGIEKSLKDHLYRTRTVSVFRNKSLKLYGRVGEDEAAFAARCKEKADEEADRDIVKVKERFAARIDRAKDAIDDARLDVETAQLDAETRRQEEFVSGTATVIGILTGRRNSRSMSTAASKRSMTRKAEQRVRKAEAEVAEKEENLAGLGSDLDDAVHEVFDDWAEKAADIETLEIGLEKSDISVEPPVLVWVPVDSA